MILEVQSLRGIPSLPSLPINLLHFPQHQNPIDLIMMDLHLSAKQILTVMRRKIDCVGVFWAYIFPP